MSKYLRLSWKVARIAPEHPCVEYFVQKILVVDILDPVFVPVWTNPMYNLKNGDMRLLKKMKNNTISSGHLIMTLKHDNDKMKKVAMQYIKHPKDIIWRI